MVWKWFVQGEILEIKADAASGIVLDIGAILKPRVEINWEKELKR